ncbi:protein OSB1, mitochondrial isoform X2 [Ziziphus jujuba]|uniref:Protein OSB1, mitochondrial isoform X2 n=1 Tax=Ziziphus jujuba TaxID=326968 RepID=A0ABM3IP74_ZIZJJ|nr:protein OSB1, mitochondrial isoform X2 [Ziziphus jujuba]
MKAVRLLTQVKKPSSSSLFVRSLAPFCSSSATNPRFRNSFSGEADSGCTVYQHVLKFQRPTTIGWQQVAKNNSASFIGTVLLPLDVIKSNNSKFGVHTLLDVRTSPQLSHGFRIQVHMWNELAELCVQHLKPNDFIYVSGRIGSYAKVTAEELNYVRQTHDLTCQKGFEPQSVETGVEKYRARLNLWQVFFTNPHEWWDNRKDKVNPKLPDFKHKDTGEALWQKPDDPPWIKKQLQLLDSKMAEQGQVIRHGSRISKWEYDE